MPTQTAVIALAAAAAAALLWRRRRRRVPPPGPQQPPLVLDARMLDRVLSTIEEEILPQTKTQLAKGNKMFGAAIHSMREKSLITKHRKRSGRRAMKAKKGK